MKTAIVIGAGIAGCSTAYALAQRDINVTLLERHTHIAAEASGNPLAMLYPRLSGDNHLSQFALAGYLHTLQLLRELTLSKTAFDACGLLQLGFNARESARIKKIANQEHEAFRLVAKSEASRLAGISLDDDALYFPDTGWLQPTALCKRLSQHKNISIYTLNNAVKILKNNNIFKLLCGDDIVFEADIIVICNSNDALEFSQSSHIKTKAVRGQITQLAATEQSKKLKMVICADGYLSPAVDSKHSLGATFSADNLDLAVIEADHLANLNTLKTISESLYLDLKNNINSGRATFRCTTPDYFPLVGQLLDAESLRAKPPRPNAKFKSLPWLADLYINVAHGSRGYTSAPLCAELLACLICNEPLPVSKELAGLLNPNRFLLREMGLKKLARTYT